MGGWINRQLGVIGFIPLPYSNFVRFFHSDSQQHVRSGQSSLHVKIHWEPQHCETMLGIIYELNHFRPLFCCHGILSHHVVCCWCLFENTWCMVSTGWLQAGDMDELQNRCRQSCTVYHISLVLAFLLLMKSKNKLVKKKQVPEKPEDVVLFHFSNIRAFMIMHNQKIIHVSNKSSEKDDTKNLFRKKKN